MGNDDIFKACKVILRSSGTPTDYLEETISRNFQKKKWIADSFNMNEENNYRLNLDLPASVDTRQEEAEFLQGIEKMTRGKYRFLDLNFMWEGKNKVRSTKIIANLWSDLVLYPDLSVQRLLSNFESDNKQRFLCSFGDRIKNGREGWVSINPIDFFTMSGEDYCSFTSCVAVENCYFNTVLHYLNSSGVVVSFATEEGSKKKIGRQIIYLSKDMIIQGRTYGCFSNSDALLIRDHLQGLLGGTWVKSSNDSGVCRERVASDTSAYIDYGYGISSYRKGYSPEPIVIDEGICLSCGDSIGSSEEGGICEECCGHGCMCDHCGRHLSEDEIYPVDNYCYCEHCFNDHYFICPECGESTSYDNGVTAEDRGDTYCRDCAESNLYYCDDCECWFEKDLTEIIDKDTKSVCNNCLKEYEICEGCEQYFPPQILDSGLCPSCLEEKESEEKSDES